MHTGIEHNALNTSRLIKRESSPIKSNEQKTQVNLLLTSFKEDFNQDQRLKGKRWHPEDLSGLSVNRLYILAPKM